MVVGLVACDGGDVYLNDKKITHLPIHQRAKLGVSYLPQEASVFPELTVIEENIKAVLELRKQPREEVEQRAEQLLEELHIGHIRNSSAASLSGGERRRVETWPAPAARSWSSRMSSCRTIAATSLAPTATTRTATSRTSCMMPFFYVFYAAVSSVIVGMARGMADLYIEHMVPRQNINQAVGAAVNDPFIKGKLGEVLN